MNTKGVACSFALLALLTLLSGKPSCSDCIAMPSAFMAASAADAETTSDPWIAFDVETAGYHTWGEGFAKGAFPSGIDLRGADDVQVDYLSFWNDGSIKHAIFTTYLAVGAHVFG